jgi:hypothetical protein
VEGGSTMNFFKHSTMPAYQKMWNFMSGDKKANISVQTLGIKTIF